MFNLLPTPHILFNLPAQFNPALYTYLFISIHYKMKRAAVVRLSSFQQSLICHALSFVKRSSDLSVRNTSLPFKTQPKQPRIYFYSTRGTRANISATMAGSAPHIPAQPLNRDSERIKAQMTRPELRNNVCGFVVGGHVLALP